MDDLSDGPAGSLDELAARLRRLHVRADRPPLRELEDRTKHANGELPGTRLRRVRLGRSTVSDVLAGRKFPKKAFLLTLVEALGVDLEADRSWVEAWDWLTENQQAPSSPEEVGRLRLENEELNRQLTAAKLSQNPALNETTITLTGDLDDKPELRWTPAGQAVARFHVSAPARFYDEPTASWVKGDRLFVTCNVWRLLAEKVAELQRGTRVIVAGRLRQRSYETKEGEKRTVYEVEVDEVSTSLRAQAMEGDTQLTIAGDCVNEPELRFNSEGQAMARFRLASTPRFYHEASGEWQDGDTLFLTCNVWNRLAEDASEYLRQGTRVSMTGRLQQRSYETETGERRTVYEVGVDEVGPSLLNADEPNGGQAPVMTELTGMEIIQRELGGQVIGEIED
jgi:single stranded DNA-binding protein